FVRTNATFYRMLLGALLVFLLLVAWAVPVWSGSMLKIGLLEEPKTLNVMRASDRWSRKVLSQIYQPLLIRDPETLALIPWLAAEAPVYNEAELSYTIKLRPAKWSDGTDLTSADIAFTGNLIKEFKVPRYISKWRFINKIETPDPQTVVFYLKEPRAIFLSRTLTTPIVQKKAWSAIAEKARGTEKPRATLLNYKVENPIACGPFVLKEWRQGAYIYLEKNPHFFGLGKTINGRVLGPYVDGSIFKFFGTSDAAVLALKKGTIDMFWWGIQPGFTLIDKEFIITRILQGQGTRMDSIVPPGNQFWHSPNLPTYGEGLSREDRVKKVYEILTKAGYTWDTPPVNKSGKVVGGRHIRLPDGKPMEKFTILTPPADYDPLRAMSGMIIQEWLRAVGIPASAKPMAFGALLDQVKIRRDYDTFILAYGALSLDPDYLRNFFHSKNDRKRGWNMSGYNNPEYDRISEASAKAMNINERRKLIWQMQQIIMNDVPYFPLYNPKLIEGVRKGKFTGWVEMLEGVGNIWSFCNLKPQ
ncbi:MAG: ABC transporter substrate-binding protein, partial [Deltaproteobacteria bacterium]|nr:ABC transporter substrate-binding protein [Deltaproteobacteria bacterium]